MFEYDPSVGSNLPSLSGSDVAEWNKMAPFTSAAAGSESSPWWQNVVSFGLVRAIDNTFPTKSMGVQGNTNPGSFAGQNGLTYNQVGGLNAAPVMSSIATMSPLVLALLAAGIYMLVKKG